MSNKKKKKSAAERELETESARIFGKHVSRQKAYVLMAVTLTACMLPSLLGLRLWQQIPELVPTGLIGANNQDDSLPRAVVVFGLPGLMAILDLICHVQLLVNQKRMTLPATPVRMMGRWGFPILSVIFCSGMMLEAAKAPQRLPLTFVTPCVLGLALLLLGGHMWDCPKDSRLALRFSFCQSDISWRAVHRFAGWLWLIAGLLVIAWAMLSTSSNTAVAALILLVLVAPAAYGYFRFRDGVL